jgi:hypothetical protein
MKTKKLLLLVISCPAIALHAENGPETPPPAATDTAPVEDIIRPNPNDCDPFAEPGSPGPRPQINPTRLTEERLRLRLRMETWEAPALAVIRLMDAGDSATDAAKIRSAFLSGENHATLLFSQAAAMDAHTRTPAESIVEVIYPTEYEPPELPPSNITPADARKQTDAWTKWLESAGKFAVPTSFETRNTGETFEAIAQPVTIAAKTWDVSATFENVSLLGMKKYGVPDLLIEMPVFSTFRINGLYRMKEGQWRLLTVQDTPMEANGKPSGQSRVTFMRIDPTP